MKQADVTKPHSDQDRGIYFWRQGLSDGSEVRCGSHVTQFTPYWCEWCNWATDRKGCFRGHGMGTQYSLFSQQPDKTESPNVRNPRKKREFLNLPPNRSMPKRAKDWVPHVGAVIHMVHDGGTVKEYQFLGLDRNQVALYFGLESYRVSLSTGRLLGHKENGYLWRMWAPDLAACKRLKRQKDAAAKEAKKPEILRRKHA